MTGQRAVYPGPRELFLDLDSDDSLARAWELLTVLNRNGYGAECVTVHPSKSGEPHRHMTVSLYREVTPIERIALQAICGSDPVREVLSLLRVWGSSPFPATVFFEPLDPEQHPINPETSTENAT